MNLIFNLFWWSIAPALVAKLLISLIVFVMGVKSIDKLEMSTLTSKSSYKFPKFFDNQTTTIRKKKLDKSKKVERIGNIVIKAIYISKSQKFVMIADGKQRVFINLNQKYKDIKLIEIGKNFAKFIRNGKYIKLFLQKQKREPNKRSMTKKRVEKTPNIVDDERYISIRRDYFDKYTKDINRFFRDIRIDELNSKDGFKGMKITFVRKNSLFDKMGLKRGDIIKEIEHEKLKSMKDVFSYYHRLKSITSLQIGLKRGKKMKEITYEID